MRFNSLEEAFDNLHNDSVEEFLREDAKLQDLAWSDYCYKYGIVGLAQSKRIHRHERTLDMDSMLEWEHDEEEIEKA